MTWAELVALVREDYLDDVVSAVLNAEEDYAWTDDFLLRVLQEAEVQACRRADLLSSSSDSDLCEIKLVTSQRNYPFSSSITRITRITKDGEEIYKVTVEELDRFIRTWRTAAAGKPKYYHITNRTIHLHPAPSADYNGDSIWLDVFYLPSGCDVEPCIPEEYHRDLIHWALYRCYSKRDEDTVHAGLAEQHLALFDMAFGSPVPNKAREHQFRSPDKTIMRPRIGYNDRFSWYDRNCGLNDEEDW